MITRCFYHSQDLDGHCSGAIVKYRFPEAIMHPINYGDEFPWYEIKPEDEVYMVDFCLQPFNGMIRLGKSCNLVWIDHHATSIEEVFACPAIIEAKHTLNPKKAACELTWEYLFPDKPVPLAVKLLSLYDSWTYQGHELEDMVLPFQMRLRMEELDPKDWGDYEEEGDPAYWWIQRLLRSDNAGTFWLKPLIEEGRLLLRYDEANKAKYARTYAFETTLHLFSHQVIRPRAFKAIAVNLGHTNSKVFDSVYDPAKHELMIPFVRRVDKLWNVSLYSTKPEIDCGEIAKSFGGGGHKGAAGFQGKELPFEI